MLFQNIGASEHWHVWLMGLTSKSGGFGDNLTLSRSRAQSVDVFLRNRVKQISQVHGLVRFKSDLTWIGETKAAISFAREEDPSDRAVLIAFDLAGVPNPAPPPKVLKPRKSNSVPCCFLRLEIAYLEAARDAWSSTTSLRRIDSGDPNTVKIDRDWFVAALKGKGYSNNRAWDLYYNGPFTEASLNDAKRMTHIVGEVIAVAKSQFKDCSSSDPTGLCERCAYSRTTSPIDRKVIDMKRRSS